MDNKYSIVITTAKDTEQASKIAIILLEKKLAACVQVSDIKSYYIWKGDVNIDDEKKLLIKCKTTDYEKIEKCIKDNHSYEIPEIILLPILKGSNSYLGWINEITS